MERSKEKPLLGQLSGKSLEQVFRHDPALAFKITVQVYLETEI